ncbi:MAG TPA: thioredoxin domain-containing protein [Tetrasphaera sp.]|uniref:DsbA family protein n=1 Tax=Nostocoides sp. TaxID=1917966 RepID=UPI002C1BCE15|nr:thioredoxin domain-containing protein [Tetrasphaera sp.]HNQ06755.1 thioredoxin domain-containing protein [Tetrasphaera sp.]
MAKNQPAPQDAVSARQAKIQQATKGTHRGGPNPLVIAGVIALVAIVAVVGFVVINNKNAAKAASEGGSALPKGVSAMGQPFVRGTPKAGAPTLDIYEDFQCPGCGQFERILGSTVKEMATSGDVQVRYHVMTFLDDNFQGKNSSRAANAAFCAADDGKFGEMHDLIYANQPTQEGKGWTDEQLTTFAGQAGLTGAALDAWTTCYQKQDHNQYVVSMQDATSKDGVTSTPTVRLNGKDLTLTNMDAAAFKKAVLG